MFLHHYLTHDSYHPNTYYDLLDLKLLLKRTIDITARSS
jgi:hypothetical protein